MKTYTCETDPRTLKTAFARSCCTMTAHKGYKAALRYAAQAAEKGRLDRYHAVYIVTDSNLDIEHEEGALFVSCGEFYTRKDGLQSFPCFGEPCGNISDYRVYNHKD